ncbi:TIGR04255 family protein [Gordonia sputi]|uniref:TIGR04255 family protein n=1 Tax=Gordonia sputi TaxID=36823 RepID=UPI0036789EAD
MPVEHEVYAKAPLVLVTTQLRYAHEPRLNSAEVRDVAAEELRSILPVLDIESVEDEAGEVTRHLRATNEQRSISVVISSQALTIDATEYTHFGEFSELLGVCLSALEVAVGKLYVERVGLRYIDEVRPPGITLTQDWDKWIAPELVSAVKLLPNRAPDRLHGSTFYEVADRTFLVFQWGEVVGQSVVAPSEVRNTLPEPGRFFVLDADAFWVPESPTAAAPTAILERFGELHSPVSETFQASLTEQAREMFRGDTSE